MPVSQSPDAAPSLQLRLLLDAQVRRELQERRHDRLALPAPSAGPAFRGEHPPDHQGVVAHLCVPSPFDSIDERERRTDPSRPSSSRADVLPNNPLFTGSQLTVQEATYAYAGWIFAQHFLNRLGPAYSALKDLLDENDSVQAGVLSDIRARFRQETFTRGSILETLQQYPDVIRLAYISFAYRHYYNVFGNSLVCVPPPPAALPTPPSR